MAHTSNPYGSPYAAPRRGAARWPWLFALLIVAAIAGVTGLLVVDAIGNEPGDASSLGQLSRPNPPEAGGELALNPIATVAPTAPPTETPVPTATAVDTQAPRRAVENWLALWSAGDYNAMYDMTSKRVQAGTSRDAFTARYAEIAEEAGLVSVSSRIAGELSLDGQIPVDVTLTSNLVGEIPERNAIPLVQEDNAYRIDWTPSLIFRQLGATGCVDFAGKMPQRGKILDRNGVVLAEDVKVSRVGVIPGDLEDRPGTIAQLSQILGIPVADIESMITIEDWNPAWFIPIKDIHGEPSIDLMNKITPLKGAAIRLATTRHYPNGALTAHITGWVSPATAEDVEADDTGSVRPDEMVGRSGLELGANELLAGKPGGSLNVIECETRAKREVIRESPGTLAQDIYLTVDLEVQRQVDAALTAQVAADGKSGQRSAAVFLDPRTGGVLAMVSHPSFDPNDAVQNTYAADERAAINDPLLRPQTNRATYERYPTGSIFKAITTAAAMRYLNYTGETPIDCPASFSIGSQQWDDWVVENGLSAQGPLTLHSGLVRSCNTVFYQLGKALDDHDPNALPDMAKAFGLGAPTGIPYFPEIAGTIPDPAWKQEVVGDGWATGDAVNLSIGQGYMEATPLQMANAYAAIANGGTLLQPYIVDKTAVPGTDPVQVGKRVEKGKLPLTAVQVGELQSALRDQTSNADGVGSAKVFGDFAWPISGKTGTAQNTIDTSGKPHSWFAAYGGPTEGGTATVTSVILVENIGEGVSYAAPATRQIYNWLKDTGVVAE